MKKIIYWSLGLLLGILLTPPHSNSQPIETYFVFGPGIIPGYFREHMNGDNNYTNTYYINNSTDFGTRITQLSYDVQAATGKLKYFIVYGHGTNSGNGIVDIGENIDRHMIPQTLMKGVSEDKKKEYSTAWSVYSCYSGAGLRTKKSDLLSDLTDNIFAKSLAPGTIMFFHGGKYTTLNSLDNDLITYEVENDCETAYERFLYFIYTPQTLKVILKPKDGTHKICFYTSSAPKKGPVTIKSQYDYMVKEINDRRDWWKKEVLNNFTDNKALTEKNCDDIAGKFIGNIDKFKDAIPRLLIQNTWVLEAYKARPEIVKIYVDAAPGLSLNPDYRIQKHISALHAAVGNNDYAFEVTKLLLTVSKITVDLQDRDGSTPLYYAIKLSYAKNIPAVIDLLLNHGAAIEQEDEGTTPLCWAMNTSKFTDDKLAMVEVLLKHNAVVTDAVLKAIPGKQLLKAILYSGNFRKTGWDYNEILKRLSDISKPFLFDIVKEACVRGNDSDKVFIQSLFDEKTLADQIPGADQFIPIALEKDPGIARILLSCILMYDNFDYAPTSVVKFGKNHKDFYDLLPGLFEKYKANLKDDKEAFIQALGTTISYNPEAIDKLLDLINETENRYYNALIQILKLAIENNNAEAVKKILHHKKVIINAGDKLQLEIMAKDKYLTLSVIKELWCKEPVIKGEKIKCKCIIF